MRGLNSLGVILVVGVEWGDSVRREKKGENIFGCFGGERWKVDKGYGCEIFEKIV